MVEVILGLGIGLAAGSLILVLMGVTGWDRKLTDFISRAWFRATRDRGETMAYFRADGHKPCETCDTHGPEFPDILADARELHRAMHSFGRTIDEAGRDAGVVMGAVFRGMHGTR